MLYFTATFLIFLAAPKRFYKAFFLSIISILIIVLYYFYFGKISDNSQRLNLDTKFFLHIKSNLSKIFELFFEKQLPLYTKGFVRSIEIIKTTNSYMWSVSLILILVFIFIFFPKEERFCPIKKKLISGIILFIAPTLLFMILDEPWLNFRNVVPSVLGFAIIIDALFSYLLKHRVKYLAIILAFYLCICNVSEIFDYHKTAENDRKIIYEVAGLYNGEKEIFYEVRTEKYLEQNSPYHDHIMSIIGSDWGLTGTVRAVLKNKNIVVKQKNSP